MIADFRTYQLGISLLFQTAVLQLGNTRERDASNFLYISPQLWNLCVFFYFFGVQEKDVKLEENQWNYRIDLGFENRMMADFGTYQL